MVLGCGGGEYVCWLACAVAVELLAVEAVWEGVSLICVWFGGLVVWLGDGISALMDAVLNSIGADVDCK